MQIQDTQRYKRCRKLALSALAAYPCRSDGSAGRLRRMIKGDMAAIRKAQKLALSSEKHGKLPQTLEWVADNAYRFEERAAKGAPALRRFPSVQLDGEGRPRFFSAFARYLSELDEALDADSTAAFLAAMEEGSENRPSFSDYYSLETLFSCAALHDFADVCRALVFRPYELPQTETAATLEKLVGSLCHIGNYRFENCFENCAAEAYLQKDPSGYYPYMSKETKNYYRSRVAFLAEKKHVSEQTFARELLERAGKAKTEKEKHIGAYLYPKKSRAAAVLYAAFAAVLTLAAVVPGVRLSAWTLVALPCVWEAAVQIANRLLSILSDDPPLPALDLAAIPDTDGVLVVVTTILDGGKGDDGIFEKLERLYHLGGMDNVYFGILGDYPDARHADMAFDDVIRTTASDRITALNRKYGNRFCLFLRRRRYSKTEQRFMGRERKRGAVCALVGHLCGREQEDFADTAVTPDKPFCERIRYVITLDADTNLPIEGIKNMVGCMLHPLNRPVIDEKKGRVVSGYGILQPRVVPELAAARRTRFSELMCAPGGIETYSFAGFDLYQTLFGEAVFCGKGIFDKNAFDAVINRSDTSFPPETVLSHDVLEGEKLRCGFLSSVEMTDGFPKNELSYYKRHHRWVRGDTQNLLFLKKRYRNADGMRVKNPFSLRSKAKLAENIRRETVPVFAMASFAAACFLPPAVGGFLTAAAFLYLILPVLYGLLDVLFSKKNPYALRRFFTTGVTTELRQELMRAFLELAMLPKNAFVTLDAMLRSGMRMLVTGRHKLEWVTAAQGDADAGEGLLVYVQKNLAGALVGGAFFVFAPYAVLKLAGLVWFFFPVAAYYLAGTRKASGTVTAEQKKKLSAYAGDLWKFFENTVSVDDHFLPVDNVQLFPAPMYAHRTSPTNIGLYLLSVLAARDFGLIDTDTLYARVYNTVNTLESMEKWRGHLYNWYDTLSLSVLEPRYVSSVDSGNYLACLIALIQGLKEYTPENTALLDVIARMEKLKNDTDLVSLYDTERDLFSLGASFESGRATVSRNCYDMYMSEARTMSYIALAGRVVPYRHLQRLSRSVVGYRDRIGLASWTGTAFEYFMPALFLPVPKGSMLYEALCFAFFCERRRTAQAKGKAVWGISESAYHAFDSERSYRYYAFGVPQLALRRGQEKELVISPYSSFLAMCVNVPLSLANLKNLKEAGAYGPFGFYEAYDFTPSRCPSGGKVVKSYMAHHVGMSIVACANAALDGVFVKRFMRDATMGAAYELLEEKIPVGAPVIRHKHRYGLPERPTRTRTPDADAEKERTVQSPSEGKFGVVSDGHVGFLWSDGGHIRLFCGEKSINASFSGSRAQEPGVWMAYRVGETVMPATRCSQTENGDKTVFRVRSDEGKVVYRAKMGDVSARTSLTEVSGASAFLAEFSVKSETAKEKAVQAAVWLEPILTELSAYQAHAAFGGLFVTSLYDTKRNALVFERRTRREDEEPLCLAVGFRDGGAFAYGTRKTRDLERARLTDGGRALFEREPDGGSGACLAPLCLIVTGLPRQTGHRYGRTLVLAVGKTAESALERLQKAREIPFEKASAPSENVGSPYGGRETDGILCDMLRAAVYPRRAELPFDVKTGLGALWECGISGDLPLYLAEVPSASAAERLAGTAAAFLALAQKGVRVDLAIICRDSEKYGTPIRKAAEKRLAEWGAAEYIGRKHGGIFPVDPDRLTDGGQALFACGVPVGEPAEEKRTAGEEALFVSQVAKEGTPCPETDEKPQVLLRSGCGYFTPDGGYTVEKNEGIRKAQSMVLYGRHAATVLTQDSLGYTFVGNASLDRITPFDGDAVRGMSGEMLYLNCGGVWYDACRSASTVHYAFGEVCYTGRVGGVRYAVKVFVPEKAGGKIVDVSTDRPAAWRFAVKPVMGSAEKESRFCVFRETDGHLAFRNPLSEDFSGGYGFLWGRDAVYHAPQAGEWYAWATVKEGLLARFCLGAYRNTETWRFFRDVLLADTGALLQSARDFARRVIPPFSVRMPTDGGALAPLAVLFSGFLPYQNGICRFYARSGFYQSGGAYGFRDQLQDALTLMYADPAAARTHILRAAAHQFAEGDVLHWWHDRAPHTGETHPVAKGIRSRCGDDYLWLVYAMAVYARYTGDQAIADVPVRYLDGQSLPDGKNEAYIETAPSARKETMLQHAKRALSRAYALTGEKGLSLLGSGDWCDGLDRAGEKGKGESVWNSLFLVLTTERFLAVFGGRLPREEREELENGRKRMADAVVKYGYDEKNGYFLRAWYDDGTPIGAATSEECRIDVLPQCFASLANVGGRERALDACRAALEALYHPETQTLSLFAPPFDKTVKEPGYIKGYAAGIRENGGQYTHAAVWGCMGFLKAALGKTEEDEVDVTLLQKAASLLMWMLPDRRGLDKALYEKYGLEAYVTAADVYEGENCRGEGGWSWYTGSAGWLYTAFLESFFGVEAENVLVPEKAVLHVGKAAFYVPFAVTDETALSLSFPRIGASYTLRYTKKRPQGADGTVLTFSEDVPLKKGEHTVFIVAGEIKETEETEETEKAEK